MRTPSSRRSPHAVVRTVAVLILAVGTLSGCMAAQPPTKAPPTVVAMPAAEDPPVFASNDAALAAATAAYAAYASLSDDVMTRKTSPDNLNSLSQSVSESYLPEVLDGLMNFANAGHLGRGSSTFDSVSLVRYLDATYGHATVEVYMCSDISGLRVVDASGADVTPNDRLNRIPLHVSFISSNANPSQLLVDKEDVWSGRNFC